MKKSTIVGATLLALGTGQALGDTRTVVLDLNTREPLLGFVNGASTSSLGRGLKNHESFVVRILNLNTERYKVKAEVASTSLFIEPIGPFAPAKPKEAAPKGAGGSGNVDAIAATQDLVKRVHDVAAFAQSKMEQVKSENDAAAVATAVQNRLTQELRDFKESIKGTENVATAFKVDESTVKDVQYSVGKLVERAYDVARLVPATDEKKKVKDELLDSKTTDALSSAYKTIQHALDKDYLVTKVLGPFQAGGDQTEVKITITDTTDKDATETVSSTIPTVGGFKIDFSGGFLGTSLKDMSYRTIPNADPALPFKAVPQTGNGNQVVTMFYLHAHVRSASESNMALTFGMSAGTSPMYAPGISFVLGREQRFMITVGETFGNVKRLAGSSLLKDSNVPTRDVFMSRPFVGISYNF